VDEVVRRGHAYLDAGMDVFFPEGLLSLAELESVARQVGAPILYNRTGVSPNLTLTEMEELRIFIVANAGGALRAASRAMWDYLHAFRAEDAALDTRLRDEMKGHPCADLHAFVGFPEIRALEAEFLPAEQIRRKYDGSLGFRP
jgi:2-methylisocitrate lyase-like PEP mutase family enzyme